jgi:aryl-alcohol dehydrogenase-like predicted oxidoreductase
MKYDTTSEADRLVVERVAKLAEERGLPRTQIALAWLLHKQPVVSPVIGATKLAHLDDPVASVSMQLSAEEIAFLEEPYVPHKIVGHN